jgi:hypothetical protein
MSPALPTVFAAMTSTETPSAGAPVASRTTPLMRPSNRTPKSAMTQARASRNSTEIVSAANTILRGCAVLNSLPCQRTTIVHTIEGHVEEQLDSGEVT